MPYLRTKHCQKRWNSLRQKVLTSVAPYMLLYDPALVVSSIIFEAHGPQTIFISLLSSMSHVPGPWYKKGQYLCRESSYCHILYALRPIYLADRWCKYGTNTNFSTALTLSGIDFTSLPSQYSAFRSFMASWPPMSPPHPRVALGPDAHFEAPNSERAPSSMHP